MHEKNRPLSPERADYFSNPIKQVKINEDMTVTIEKQVASKGLDLFGKIRYDRTVTEAMVHGKSIVEYSDSPVTEDIREVWKKVSERLEAAIE